MEKTKFPKHSHSSMAFMNQLVNYPPHHNYSGAYSQDNLSHSFVKKIWRKGKWTEEEENYAEKIVLAFNAGILDLPTGTTLRSALSELLNW